MALNPNMLSARTQEAIELDGRVWRIYLPPDSDSGRQYEHAWQLRDWYDQLERSKKLNCVILRSEKEWQVTWSSLFSGLDAPTAQVVCQSLHRRPQRGGDEESAGVVEYAAPTSLLLSLMLRDATCKTGDNTARDISKAVLSRFATAILARIGSGGSFTLLETEVPHDNAGILTMSSSLQKLFGLDQERIELGCLLMHLIERGNAHGMVRQLAVKIEDALPSIIDSAAAVHAGDIPDLYGPTGRKKRRQDLSKAFDVAVQLQSKSVSSVSAASKQQHSSGMIHVGELNYSEYYNVRRHCLDTAVMLFLRCDGTRYENCCC
jgi:hypothetical protein